jgi:membrane protein YdbS with pleckstrin-like domain
MAEQEIPPQDEREQHAERLAKRARLIAVIYRIILTAGLLLMAAAAVLVFFTRRAYLWVLSVPLVLIALGIFLARVEYRLDLQSYSLENQEPEPGEDKPEL